MKIEKEETLKDYMKLLKNLISDTPTVLNGLKSLNE